MPPFSGCCSISMVFDFVKKDCESMGDNGKEKIRLVVAR